MNNKGESNHKYHTNVSNDFIKGSWLLTMAIIKILNAINLQINKLYIYLKGNKYSSSLPKFLTSFYYYLCS